MGGLAVFAVAFAVYAWTAQPAMGWLDSPELLAASADLGVAHSPGHPVPVLLGHLATLVPVGDLAFRVALASALAVAAAAALCTCTITRLGERAAPTATPWLRQVVAVAGGLTFALSGAAWLQAVRVEVYGLAIALVALAIALLVADARRHLVAAALVLGLALANHHFMTLLAALPLAAWILAGRPGWRPVVHATGAALLGLAAYAYLPLRALRDPLVNWGDPDTPARFVWTVTARAFQKSLGPDTHTDTRLDDLLQTVGTVGEHVGWPAVLVLLVGFYALVRSRAVRGPVLALAGVLALAIAGRAALGFDFGNPDALGYLLPAVFAGTVLAGTGLCVAAPPLGRAAPVVALVALAAIPLQLVVHGAAAGGRHAEAADRWAHALADELPPRAVVLTGHFETAFQLWALAAVEQLRPDVVHVDRGFDTHPGFAASTARRHPELAPALAAGLRVGAPTPLAALVALHRPIVVEPVPTIDDALRRAVAPRGPWLLLGGGAFGRDGAAQRRFNRRVLAGGGELDTDLRRRRAWLAWRRADFYCGLGVYLPGLVAAARDLADGDSFVDELAARCRAGARR